MKWLDSIREWQEEFVGNMTAREFVDTITGDLFSSRVFVFSTSGEPLNLPKGATVIDYAYQKDTQMANRMVGAKVRAYFGFWSILRFSVTFCWADLRCTLQ